MMKNTSSLEPDRNVTLEAAVERFLADEQLSGKSEATIGAHRNALRQFGKVLGKTDLREATAGDLEAYARELRKRVSRETAYGYLATVRGLFRYLAETNVLLLDPSRHLAMPRMSNRPLGRVLSGEEIRTLLQSPEVETPVGLRDRALLELLYSTGLRLSEVQKLSFSDLGEDALTVRKGKGAKDRVVPIGARALEWVSRYLKDGRPHLGPPAPGVEAVFLNGRGCALGKEHLRVVLRSLGKATGIRDLTCHAIRRTMATHLLRSGAIPKEVSAILGHSDLKSLSRYVRIAAVDVKATHEKTHPRELGS